MKYYIFLLIILGSFIVTSCSRSRDLLNLPFDGEYALPLFKSRGVVGDIFQSLDTSNILVVNDDGSMTLRYVGETTVNTAINFFQFFNVIPFPDSVIQIDAYNDVFKIRIDTLMLKSGTMTILINNTANSSPNGTPVPFTLYLPEWKKNGVPFEQDFVAPFEESFSLSFDISGYSIVPVNGKFNARYKAVNDVGQQVEFDGFFLNANNTAVTQYAQGGIGYQVTPPFRDTLEIDFFQQLPDGSYQFADPRLVLSCQNSWGVPSKVIVTEAKWVSLNGQVDYLVSPITNPTNPDNGITINYPTIEQVGQSVPTSFEFNRDNSNIRDILNSKPTRLIYQALAITNPTNDLNITSFMLDTSALNTRFDLEIPLHGSVLGQSYVDTFPIDLTQGGTITLDVVGSIEFKLKSLNSVPLEATVDLIGLDEFNQPLGSLTNGPQKTISAPEVDGDGFSVAPVSQISFVEIDNQTLRNVFGAKYVALKIVFTTSAGGVTDVKIRADDIIHIDCGVKIKLQTD
jgi:hypothetical protein